MAELLDLKKRMEAYENRRILRSQFTQDSIEGLFIVDGVRFIRDGLDADLPERGEQNSEGAPLYYAHDTKKLYIWRRTAEVWSYVQLT